MPDLIDTTEMYLKTLFELIEEGIVPMRARIVERLDQAGPTVSQTVARMERDGLLVVGEDRAIKLTDAGLERAATVMRRHRLAECMLISTLGVSLDIAHDEACRWEHVMTGRIEGRVAEFLGDPVESPYGMPIPAFDEGAALDASTFRDPRTTVREIVDASDGEVSGEVTGIAELAQATGWLLADLDAAGITVGAQVTACLAGQNYVVRAAQGGEVTVIGEFAEAIYVADR